MKLKAPALAPALAAFLVATSVWAGDAEIGRQLAQSRCSVCHAIGPRPSDELADAPPFELIARRFPAESGSLLIVLRGPHPKMNFSPSQREAEDIAEYIRSLAR